MSIEIKVPPLPESVTDATLVAWHKSVGDGVARDENLVDLETDKVVLEVPAPAAGVIKEIRIDDGATVRGGELLAVLEEGAAPAATSAEASAPAAEPDTETPRAALIEEQHVNWLAPQGQRDFAIRTSRDHGDKHTQILPDIATCDDCAREVADPTDRRHRPLR